MSVHVEVFDGSAVRNVLTMLAELRIEIFREFPYLYEGDLEYEARYLDVYARSPRSRVVLVWDDGRVVGASTVLPLLDAPDEIQSPFLCAGMAIDEVDYLGESVLLPAYRGQGFGVRFFELREAHAREHGLSVCAFCAVERATNHSRRPIDFVTNDAFWTKRGYQKSENLKSELTWLDRGEREPTPKLMTFWLKRLAKDSPGEHLRSHS